ncbi:MAG: hypothetical protein LC808_20405 [Actinobacteria bacterium]|nr:hypothetical protein [Actinomycetota bacterium]
MRKVLTTVFATAVALSAIGPAWAEPASSSSAAAYGISARVLGTQLVPPTPSVAVSQPPDTGLTLNGNVNSTVPLDLQGLAVAGVVVAVGEAHRADDIVPALTTNLGAGSDAVTLTGVNARGLARAENLNLVGNIQLLQLLGGAVVSQGLVSAGSVQAEAVAKCVNNQPVFDTGYNVVDLKVAGTDIPLNSLLAPLLAALNLPGVVTVTLGEKGDLPGGGVFINALHISVPLLQADIIVGHAEAGMPANCGIAPPAPPAPPTGPGDIAPIADLGNLAATGGDFSVTPLVAMALLGAALGIRRLTVRAQRSSSTVA